ncbi:hypothetical protein B0O80DRAFT_463902, partial [Mortierella sp. GBAus27b]
ASHGIRTIIKLLSSSTLIFIPAPTLPTLSDLHTRRDSANSADAFWSSHSQGQRQCAPAPVPLSSDTSPYILAHSTIV